MGNSDDDVCGFLPKIDDKSPQGFLGRLKLSELRPTQNGVGMDEVKAKVKGLQDKSGGKLLDYLLPRTVPIVIGNNGYYLIDHHHLGISLWIAKGDIDVPVLVTRNWAPIQGDHFWKTMADNDWVYPYSALGAGPFNPNTLKQHVKDLDNDLYRSLSWLVREDYGYVKDASNPIFAEFKWGSFFRTRVIFKEQLTCKKEDSGKLTLKKLKHDDPDDYADKIRYAKHLAASPDAAGLPGFGGRSR